MSLSKQIYLYSIDTSHFYTDEEKINEYKKYNLELDKIISKLENNTSYKFGKDYVTPIRIND